MRLDVDDVYIHILKSKLIISGSGTASINLYSSQFFEGAEMSSVATRDGQKHVLLFPYPAQGHMLAMLDLADQLVRRNLHLTILVTPKNLEILNPLLSKHPKISTLVLPLPKHPMIPVGIENIKDLGNHGNIAMMNALGKLHSEIVEWFNDQDESIRPVAIVSDFFLGWTEKVAGELGIRRIAFYSSTVFCVEVMYYCWKDIDNVLSLDVVEFKELPGSPKFKHEHLPTIVLKYKNNKSDPEWEFIRESFNEGAKSWGVVFNTFYDMDGVYFDHCVENMEQEKAWSVGPLRLMSTFGIEIRVVGPEDDNLLKWLDGCSKSSVVYVCFGSQKTLSKAQMEALAKALEVSGSRFIWGVKQATTAEQMNEGFGHVPDGFEERVKERGKVVRGWVPQDAILNHEAVAYFLSHCGWNSVIEGVVGGVGIFAWPMEADQYVNATLLEKKGVAVRICEGSDNVPDYNALGRTISEVMNGDQSMLSKAKELSDKARKAVETGGSSTTALDQLAEDLKQLQNI